MDKGEGEKTKRKRTFSVLGKMLAISESSGVVGQVTEKYAFDVSYIYVFYSAIGISISLISDKISLDRFVKDASLIA